jgi:hypothetical protein
VAQFLDRDHRRVLVQRLVDRDHLPHLHEHLDHFRRLDRHLVRELGHGDGLGHVHFEHARLRRSRLLALVVALVALVATAPFGAGAPGAAPHAAARIAARLDLFFLGRVARPARRQLGRLDFLAAARRGRRRRARSAARTGTRLGRRLVQSAFFGVARRLGRGFGLFFFLFLLGHHHGFFGRGQHGTNGRSLGLGLAPARFEVCGTRGLFCGARFGLGLGLFTLGLLLRRTRCSLFGLLAHCLLLGRRGLGFLFGLLRSVGSGAFVGFALAPRALFALLLLARFALAPLLRQRFFLAPDQLGLLARLFLAALPFVLLELLVRLHLRLRLRRGRRLGARLGRVLALDEGAFFAHLDLDGARLAARIGLLDLGGGFLHQGDLFAVARSGAVAGLQVGEQLLLVDLGEPVGSAGLGHACGAQLVEQDGRGFLEFGGELCNGITGHKCFVPP